MKKHWKVGISRIDGYIEPKVNNIENNTNKLTQQKKFGSTHRLIKVLQPMWVEDS